MSRRLYSNIEQFAKLRESASPVDTAALDSFFDQLPPIPLSHLVGSWNGGFFDTGHPNGDFMKDISWIGKDFFSVDHVDPVIIERDGTRRPLHTDWGSKCRSQVCLDDHQDVFMVTATVADRARFSALFVETNSEQLETLGKWVMERKLEPVISGSFRLGDASQAFAILKSGKARGKLVLNVKDHILEAT
ncbi:Uncharacterized protein HZ326_18821 [Fusarium oxysporum f. sp. albedinis]|nr:Uncharacterized protein HZ326_18821 [Fusarium oxysporum f. sp. albedinis]